MSPPCTSAAFCQNLDKPPDPTFCVSFLYGHAKNRVRTRPALTLGELQDRICRETIILRYNFETIKKAVGDMIWQHKLCYHREDGYFEQVFVNSVFILFCKFCWQRCLWVIHFFNVFDGIFWSSNLNNSVFATQTLNTILAISIDVNLKLILSAS